MARLKFVLSLYVEMLHAIAAGFRAPRVLALLSVSAVIALTNALLCMWIEGWDFVDALYFSVVSMATVGYGDLSPQSDLGKIVNIPFLVIGIGVFVLTVTELAKTIFADLESQYEAHHNRPKRK
jgi:voltage-gated potassium channel